jgi:hypothetical protein
MAANEGQQNQRATVLAAESRRLDRLRSSLAIA